MNNVQQLKVAFPVVFNSDLVSGNKFQNLLDQFIDAALEEGFAIPVVEVREDNDNSNNNN